MHEGKSPLRILVVEDEAKVASALREGLEREKYEVVVAPTGEEGFFLVNAEEFDLVILDLMLPGRDGLQVLATLRKRGLQTPVLIVCWDSTRVLTITSLNPSRSRSFWRGFGPSSDAGGPNRLFRCGLPIWKWK
jgi:CheY-like chemotaxis protein